MFIQKRNFFTCFITIAKHLLTMSQAISLYLYLYLYLYLSVYLYLYTDKARTKGIWGVEKKVEKITSTSQACGHSQSRCQGAQWGGFHFCFCPERQSPWIPPHLLVQKENPKHCLMSLLQWLTGMRKILWQHVEKSCSHISELSNVITSRV